MGVLALDPNASKGILTTTSDFAPRLLEDPRLAEALPHRIELMNGAALRKWLNDLVKKS
jgi:restriction system protein